MTKTVPPGRFYDKYRGKYRGKVVNNLDPLLQGRIVVNASALSG